MWMNKSTQREYNAAMSLLEELCAVQRIRVNDKLREIFWQGFIQGWNRASTRTAQPDAEDNKPIRSKANSTERDSRVDSALGLSDVPHGPHSNRQRSTGLNDAGVFRI